MDCVPLLLCQVLVSLAVVQPPARRGVCVPTAALERGIGLAGAGALSWRPLPVPPHGGCQWIEVGLDGCRGDVRIVAGRCGAASAFVEEQEHERLPDGAVQRRSLRRWAGGAMDRCASVRLLGDRVVDGERLQAGELLWEESPDCARRSLPVLSLGRRTFERWGLLPQQAGLGVPFVARLRQAAHAMVELPGRRGAGDYARSGPVVTNLEFDTTLALLRIAVALGDEELWLRARRAARHSMAVDLDAASGLPFAHGKDHRSAAAAPGHAWLQGLLWMGLLSADTDMIEAARQIAEGLAAMPIAADGDLDRARVL